MRQNQDSQFVTLAHPKDRFFMIAGLSFVSWASVAAAFLHFAR
jgi:hypothetical protein